jgi:hypothetical protein
MHRTPEQRRERLIALGKDPARVAALAMDPDGPRIVRIRAFETAEPYAPEYESERLTAAQLGVGRFHDGRGL